MKTIKLRNGSEEAEPIVRVTMLSLENLAGGGCQEYLPFMI
jgi:hypothetical protein